MLVIRARVYSGGRYSYGSGSKSSSFGLIYCCNFGLESGAVSSQRCCLEISNGNPSPVAREEWGRRAAKEGFVWI